MIKKLIAYWAPRLNNHYTLIAIVGGILGMIFFKQLEQLLDTISSSETIATTIVVAFIGYFSHKK